MTCSVPLRRRDEGACRISGRARSLGGAGSIGQQLQKQIGQTGIPVYNVANACATGATALRTAIMAVKAGEADYGLAVGKLASLVVLDAGNPIEAVRLRPERLCVIARGKVAATRHTERDTLRKCFTVATVHGVGLLSRIR